MSTIRRNEDDVFLEALDKWQELNPGELHWDNDIVIDWMMAHEGFGLDRRVIRRELAKKLSRALNRKHVRNEQGKRVKAFHSARLPVKLESGKIVQKQLWGDRLTMSESFAHASMSQCAKQIEGACKSAKASVDDLNQNNPNLAGNPIQLNLDFSYVAEPKQKSRVVKLKIDAEPPTTQVKEEPSKKKRRPR